MQTSKNTRERRHEANKYSLAIHEKRRIKIKPVVCVCVCMLALLATNQDKKFQTMREPSRIRI